MRLWTGVLLVALGCTAGSGTEPLPAGDGGSGDSGSGDSGSGDSGALPPDTVIYTIRHAEKEDEGTDPDLTEAGQVRAVALAELLHEVPLASVYATEYQRTQQTVQPTADDHGLVTVTDIDPERELAEHILDADAGLTVLACGHSNTVPDFLRALGMEEPPDIESDVFGELWIVTVTAAGEFSVETSHYGE